MLVIECQFPQNPTCSLLPNTCCVHGIELCNLSIFMKSGKIQNLFGPHLLALLSLLPSSRFRIWISGCQTLQCPLTPRLSHPLSCLFPSCPKFSTPFSFPKILPVLRMWPQNLSTLLVATPAFHRSSNMLLSHSAAALRFHACMCDVFRHSVCKVCSKIVRCSFPQLLSSMLCWWWWQACRHGHWLVEISFIEPFPFVLPYYWQF